MGRITETHVAIAIVTMVTVNVGGETNIPLNLMHGRKECMRDGIARLTICLEFRKYTCIS